MKVRRWFMVLAVVFISMCGALCMGSILAGCGKSGDAKGKIADSDRSGYEALEFQPIVAPEGLNSFAICSDGTMLGNILGGNLYLYDKNGTKQQEVSLDGSYLAFVCTDGDAVYAYDYNKGAVVELTGEVGVDANADSDNALFGTMTSENIRVIQNSIAFHTIRNMTALDGKIYLLAVPLTEKNEGTFFSFGMQEFEDYGEIVYCIDASNGQYKTLDLGHIAAEYRSEDGRLFFYGWAEDKYYLYEYDTEKEQISGKLSFDSMGNLLNIVVEGGYLFGISPSDGLVSIDLTTGEKLTWASGVYAIFGNDLQFYRGNLFVRNMAATQEIQQVLVVDRDGKIAETVRDSGSFVADDQGAIVADGTGDGGESADGTDLIPQPTERAKRSETIGVGVAGNLLFSADQVRNISGMRTKVIEQSLDLEALVAELMAGNPDVDIYVFPYGWALTQRIEELGFYVPLNSSEIISGYLGKCFDYIQNASTSEDGNIWMIPVYESCEATWYIPENMQKFGVTPEELTMFDSYIAVLERLHDEMGEYRYYNNAATFMAACDSLYDANYNNYDMEEINFDTELYRHLADFFWTGWDRYGSADANHPLFFKVLQQTAGTVTTLGETPDFDRNSVIFKTIYINEHLINTAKVGSEKFRELLEGWRVLPFPKLQSDSEKGSVAISYAFVNPYSRQQEAAVEYLECILENQTDLIRQPLFLREDMEYYEPYYDTSVLAFQDLYNIYKNADVFHGHSWDLSDEYITDYQRGLISFDEAIERRQKKAVTGLYE